VRREPPLTFRGALQILGHHDRPWLEGLDKLLGGAILAAGAAGAAVGSPLVGGAVVLGLWGAVDQKNQAMILLRERLDRLADRRLGTSTYERAELIAAAHTTIVVTAFFEVLHERLDAAGLPNLKLLESEIAGLTSSFGDHLISGLLDADVPAPSASAGFRDNTVALKTWYQEFARRVAAFLAPLNGGDRVADLLEGTFVVHTIARYETRYLGLAAAVPEFRIWAGLGEHAATRAAQTQALSRLEALLRELVIEPAGRRDQCEALARCNRAVLDMPVMRGQSQPSASPVRFPLVRDIHLNPRYRICRLTDRARPADDDWWADLPVRPDLDLCLTAHLLSVEATRQPLLLLGHPGAGKSLLTKVLAARLPAETYTVVRVPLRSVPANERLLAQLQHALDETTNNAVQWRTLVEQSQDTVRVVLLDGLDELLQATPHDRSGYLHDVADFQEKEAVLGRPVVVVVTSRTVVADRVDVPAGTSAIRLEDFDDGQVAAWLDTWTAANAAAIAAGTVRPLGVDTALGQAVLGRQPLLLLMLALYAADPETPELEAGMSTTELYRRLFDLFARREVGNRPDPPTGTARDEAIRDQLDRLAVAALAMFNRGRQDITDNELATDLAALDGTAPGDGRRLLGEFFFVHVAEAVGRASPVRAYEFLHATFGEYLVARRIVDEVTEAADVAFGGRRGPRRPTDDLLFALLRYRPLAVRQSTLDFARDMFAALPEPDRRQAATLLGLLLAGHRHREPRDAYAAYRPQPCDHARELAAYSANLVLLHTTVHEPVLITNLFPDTEDPAQAWTGTVHLWRAALDTDAWQSTALALERDGGVLRAARAEPGATAVPVELAHAGLVADRRLERALRYGLAITEGVHVVTPGRDWGDTVATAFLPPLVHGHSPFSYTVNLPRSSEGVAEHEVAQAVNLLWHVMDANPVAMERGQWRTLTNWVTHVMPAGEQNLVAVASLVANNPKVLRINGRLTDPASWDRSVLSRLLLRARLARETSPDPILARLVEGLRFDDLPDELRAVEPAVLDGIVLTLAEMFGDRINPTNWEEPFRGVDLDLTLHEWPG
jgi:hypothetical protein